MSRRLRDNINSSYFEAANRLTSKKARRRIVAYVESYDDVFFWRSVLSQYETDKVYFEVMLPTRDSKLERGKKAALMSMMQDKVGADMVACVDADYDYLLQGATQASRFILESPYTFHTYAYAIENLQCYAPTLRDVCVAITLNDHQVFDMEEFLRQYSQAIYPLFVWNIWYYRQLRYKEFSMTDFLRMIDIGGFKLHSAEQQLANLRQKVDRRVRGFQRVNPDARESWAAVKDDLKRLGVTADNTYLFIQGHHLYDKVVIPMLERVCTELVRERQNEICRQSVHGTQRHNELSAYQSRVEDINVILQRSTGYLRSEACQRIGADIQAFLQGDTAQPAAADQPADA